MAQAARLGDSIQGTTSGEHSGHEEAHGPSAISGEISGRCSGDVFINRRAAAVVGSTTAEMDVCCGNAAGSVAAGSGSVFINGKPTARQGDALKPHDGEGRIASGSSNVFIGG